MDILLLAVIKNLLVIVALARVELLYILLLIIVVDNKYYTNFNISLIKKILLKYLINT
jgi:hypothetical protein